MTTAPRRRLELASEILFQKLAGRVARHPLAVLCALCAVTALCAWLALGLRVDADIAGLLPSDSATRRLVDKYTDPAAVSELLLVGVSHPALLAPERLAQVAAIDSRLHELPEVRDSLTPFNLRTFQRNRGRLLLGPLAPGGTVPVDGVELERWRDRLPAAPPPVAALFNAEVPAVNLVYSVGQRENYDSLLQRVRAIVAAHGEALSIRVGGWLPVYEVTRSYIVRELPLLGGIAALITLLVCLLSFATLRAVALPLLAIGMALLWTLGLMAFAGVPLSLSSLMLPPLIFALGSSYSVHLMNRYFGAADSAAPDGSRPRVATEAAGAMNSSRSRHPTAHRERRGARLARRDESADSARCERGAAQPAGMERRSNAAGVSPPAATRAVVARATGSASQTVVLASLTTAAGFASLLVSGIPRVREFGLFAAAGILICALVTLLLYPAVLALLPLPTCAQRERLTRGRAATLAAFLTRFAVRRRWPLFALLGLLAVAFAAALGGVRYQTDVAGFFRGSVPAVEDNRVLMDRFGSYLDLNLTVTVGDAAGISDASLLRALAEFEESVQGHRYVSHVTSIVGYLRALNHAVAGSASYPQNPTVVSLFQRFLKLGAASGIDFGGLVDFPRGRVTTRIWIRSDTTGWLLLEHEMRELVQFLRGRAERAFPAHWEPELWGWSMVTLRVAEILAREQLVSTVASILLVLLITSVAFRSLRFGLLALLPLSTAIMLAFILMALFRIPLDALTVSFAGVAIGVGVDDSIHFLLHYRRARRRDHLAAVAVAMQHAGRAILITTAAIVAGMAPLAFSRFLPVVYLAALISTTLIGATLGTLVLVPALLRGRGAPVVTS